MRLKMKRHFYIIWFIFPVMFHFFWHFHLKNVSLFLVVSFTFENMVQISRHFSLLVRKKNLVQKFFEKIDNFITSDMKTYSPNFSSFFPLAWLLNSTDWLAATLCQITVQVASMTTKLGQPHRNMRS